MFTTALAAFFLRMTGDVEKSVSRAPVTFTNTKLWLSHREIFFGKEVDIFALGMYGSDVATDADARDYVFTAFSNRFGISV